MNDILTNKIQSLQRCVARAREEYNKVGSDFRSAYTCLDSHTQRDSRMRNSHRSGEPHYQKREARHSCQ